MFRRPINPSHDQMLLAQKVCVLAAICFAVLFRYFWYQYAYGQGPYAYYNYYNLSLVASEASVLGFIAISLYASFAKQSQSMGTADKGRMFSVQKVCLVVGLFFWLLSVFHAFAPLTVIAIYQTCVLIFMATSAFGKIAEDSENGVEGYRSRFLSVRKVLVLVGVVVTVLYHLFSLNVTSLVVFDASVIGLMALSVLDSSNAESRQKDDGTLIGTSKSRDLL